MISGYWTTEEVETLQKMAGNYPAKVIAEKLGRTYQSVIAKACNNNISLMLHGEKHHSSKTSDEDRRLILELYHGSDLTIAEIAEKFEIPYSRTACIIRGY